MSGTIGNITSSVLAETALAAQAASSTSSTGSSSVDTAAKISCLAKAIGDSVSIISGILNPVVASGTEDATYNFLLAAKSEGIMKAAPTFLNDVITAQGSGEVSGSVNAVTMDTETLVSILQKSMSSEA